MDYPGKVISKNAVVPSQTSASGVWTLDDAAAAVESNTWPVAGVPNPISRSLRFNSADSTYLNRTPASAGNRKTWTWSGWVKRSAFGTFQGIFGGGGTSPNYDALRFTDTNTLQFFTGGAVSVVVATTAVFRDPSAWYHIAIAFDTTQATSANRVRLYVNGVEQTLSGTFPNQNTDWNVNTTVPHSIGAQAVNGGYSALANGYLTEVNFIDGQALTPSDFGLTDPQTGAWIPKAYTGTYGTNGFYLNFSDNASTAALGTDYSGNSNTWTTNNFSVTAGAGNDSMTDVPTPWIPYNTTGDVGGVVRGNYCTWNGVGLGGGTLSNGNLDGSFTIQTGRQGTFTLDNGSWYWETTVTTIGNAAFLVGIIASSETSGVITGGAAGINVFYQGDSNIRIDNVVVTTVATYTSGDVIGISYNGSTREIKFFKNNSLQTTQTATANYSYVPWVCAPASGTSVFSTNFGQRPFAYTPPAGFLSLCTTNLPTPTILDGGEYFNTVLYTGDGASSHAITGLGFQPDLVWTKSRSGANPHVWIDSVRGLSKYLISYSTNAEGTNSTLITSFDSDGFTIGTDDLDYNNYSGETYVAWNWKANGTPAVTNTDGTITSSISVNTTSGFSIVTYTGTGSAATVGHGLGVAPDMMICKNRDNGSASWIVYHKDLTNAAQAYIYLNLTNAANEPYGGYWNSTAPTSTQFTVGTDDYTNQSGAALVNYLFAAIPGYSAFGSYTGNGNATDGPFVFCNFRPAFLIVKRTDSTGAWLMIDSTRSTYNEIDDRLYPNLSVAEDVGTPFDFLSNGFKLRNNGASLNNSGGSYIYMAFAENPFKYSNAR